MTTDWQAWQRSWDHQQEIYLPDREQRFEVMLDVVEAVVGTAPRVLDLACGTGSISIRLLRRFPDARPVGVDVDPALLRIARGSLTGDGRATIVRANLADPTWLGRLPKRSFDAVLTATALHWLADDTLSRLYADLAGVVRPGGVFCNADHMPDRPAKELDARLDAWARSRRDALVRGGAVDWAGWWQLATADPALSDAVAERDAIFGARHAQEFNPPVDWHLEALRAAGFRETTVAWRRHGDALVVGLR